MNLKAIAHSIEKKSLFNDIKSFAQGMVRAGIVKYGGALKDHIVEQIVWRLTVSKPECLAAKECYCGCPIPELQFADKACEHRCYPEMMNKRAWKEYKQTMDIRMEDVYTKAFELASQYPEVFDDLIK